MKANPRIQQTWRKILSQVIQPGDAQCRQLDEGYYAVAQRPWGGKGTVSLGPAADYESLRSCIPHLDRTRAVPLNFRHGFEFPDDETLGSWAGELAADVETGALHAFAVVDSEAFGESVAAELRAAGWQVERVEEELRVTDGLFVRPVNLLRVIVEMVIARGGIAEARCALRERVAGDFNLFRGLFRRFAERFIKFEPAVVDHYFAAYPGASCVAAGWDYWQVTGMNSSDPEQVFQRAMEEFNTFLTPDSDEWLAGVLASPCQRQPIED